MGISSGLLPRESDAGLVWLHRVMGDGQRVRFARIAGSGMHGNRASSTDRAEHEPDEQMSHEQEREEPVPSSPSAFLA